MLLALAVVGLSACSGTSGEVISGKFPSLVKLGDDLNKEGDPEGAATMYRAAAGQDGRNAGALIRLGEVAAGQGEPGRAEQAYRAAILLDPRSVQARQGLARALLVQNHPADALPLLRSLVDDQPDPRRFRAYGAALDMVGRPVEAQAAYRRGLELSPADANLHGNLALSLAVSGEVDAAMAEMRAAELAPLPDPRQEANVVLLLAVTGHVEEARRKGMSLLGPTRTDLVLHQAQRFAAAPDPAARAREIGLLVATPATGSVL